MGEQKMAIKNIFELKKRASGIAEELKELLEGAKLDGDAKDELGEIVEQICEASGFEEQETEKQKTLDNWIEYHNAKKTGKSKEVLQAEELAVVCRSASSGIDVVVQKYDMEDGFSEKLEDVSLDLNVTARQCDDFKKQEEKKRKPKEKKQKVSLDRWLSEHPADVAAKKDDRDRK